MSWGEGGIHCSKSENASLLCIAALRFSRIGLVLRQSHSQKLVFFNRLQFPYQFSPVLEVGFLCLNFKLCYMRYSPTQVTLQSRPGIPVLLHQYFSLIWNRPKSLEPSLLTDPILCVFLSLCFSIKQTPAKKQRYQHCLAIHTSNIINSKVINPICLSIVLYISIVIDI